MTETVHPPSSAAGRMHAFAAYLQERYAPLPFAVFYLLVSFALLGRFAALFDVAFSARLGGRALLLAGMLFLFFFVLRVFDEHKDREADRVSFPDRVLSRGLIGLHHLRAAAAGSVLLLAAASLTFGFEMLLATLLLLAYALLMLKEFFIGAWLKRHLFVYGITHNAVVFLAMHWCFLGFGLVTGHPEPYLIPELSLVALAFNGLFFSLEVARKIRMPAAERPHVDTYSKVIGPRAAAVLAVGIHPAVFALLAWSGTLEDTRAWVLLGVVFALLTLHLIRFLQRPTEAAAEHFLKPVSAAVLAYLLVLGVAPW